MSFTKTAFDRGYSMAIKHAIEYVEQMTAEGVPLSEMGRDMRSFFANDLKDMTARSSVNDTELREPDLSI